MEFFIPAAKSAQHGDELYECIRKHVSKVANAEFSDRRVRILQWFHDGKKHEAEVGKETSFNRELVVAILHEPKRNLYHVCTPNRGVIHGLPIFAGGNLVRNTLDFKAS